MTCSEGARGGHYFKRVGIRWVCWNCPEVRDKTGTRVVVDQADLLELDVLDVLDG